MTESSPDIIRYISDKYKTIKDMAKEIKNENAEAIVEAVSKTEQFFEKNGKLLILLWSLQLMDLLQDFQSLMFLR